jgi:hypothetical protein
MTPRERVLATFAHQKTDKVPIHHLGCASRVASMILGREAYIGGGIQQWREATALWEGEGAHRAFLQRSLADAFDLARALNHDILRLEYWRMPTKPTKRIDEYTFFYGHEEKSWRVMRYDPETELYQVITQSPDEREETTFQSIERNLDAQEKALENQPLIQPDAHIAVLMEKYGREYAIRVGGGALSIPYDQIWLEAVALRPDLVARHLDIQVEQAVRRIGGLAQIGVKFIFGGGDFAANEGPFYSPKIFHELMLPRLQKIAKACHQHGMYYLFASDGNLWPVADDLFGHSGVDGYYEIDRRAGMDLRRLRERFPKLILIGNISSHTLHLGTKAEVVAETISCIKEAKRSGGVIVGVSNYMLPGTPAENLRAMMETINVMREA